MMEGERLLNDERITETALECQHLCFHHAPPDYPENCRSWTWVRRRHRSDFQECYLYDRTIESDSWAKGISGTCRGGVSKSDEALQEEITLCPKILESAENLQVWLRVRRRLSIDLEKTTILLRFMKLVNMCTSDTHFMDVFNEFVDESPEEEISIFEPLKAMYELIHDLWDLLHDNAASITWILSILYTAMKYLFPQLHPYFDKGKELVDRLIHKKEIEEQQTDENEDADADADASPVVEDQCGGDSSKTRKEEFKTFAHEE